MPGDLGYPRNQIDPDSEKGKGVMAEKILIVVDMQKDFVNGSLGSKDAEAIVPAVVKKAETFDGEVIFTKDTHFENYMDTQEGHFLPVPHCIEETKGWEIADGLEVPDAIYINKTSFGYTGWGDFDLQDVEMVGLCTDICVVSNALIIKALYPEISVKFDARCCAGVTPESHEAALATMSMCQVDIVR